MNAPPGFLEFLLCIPWRQLPQLYPHNDNSDELLSHLHVSDTERHKLVNARIPPSLLAPVLDFLYRPEHADSVPPSLLLHRPTPNSSATSSHVHSSHSTTSRSGSRQQVNDGATLESVAALLDGATPLHCAALRGNPAQVDHLLYCGADPTRRTTAGELPIELVPVCGDRNRATKQRTCRCLGHNSQEVCGCSTIEVDWLQTHPSSVPLPASCCLSALESVPPWHQTVWFGYVAAVGCVLAQ